jgi:hypothetical protein
MDVKRRREDSVVLYARSRMDTGGRGRDSSSGEAGVMENAGCGSVIWGGRRGRTDFGRTGDVATGIVGAAFCRIEEGLTKLVDVALARLCTSGFEGAGTDIGMEL